MHLLTYIYIFALSNASTLSQLQDLFRKISDDITVSTASDTSQAVTANLISNLSTGCVSNLPVQHELEQGFCAVPNMTRFILALPNTEYIMNALGYQPRVLNWFVKGLAQLGSVYVQPEDPSLPYILLPQSYSINTESFTTLANAASSSLGDDATLIQNYDAFSYILQCTDETVGENILHKTRTQVCEDYQSVDEFCTAPSLPVLPHDSPQQWFPFVFGISAQRKSFPEVIIEERKFVPTDSCPAVPVVECDRKRDLLGEKGYRPMCTYKSKSSSVDLITFEDTNSFNYSLVLNVLDT